MTSSLARTLPISAALGLVAIVGAPAFADPPAAPAEDPRVDTLARLHAAFVTRVWTGNLFTSVSGPHADLCRIDHRDAAGATVLSRWYRFGDRRWELASQNQGPAGGKTLIHEVLDLDAKGRPERSVLTMTFAHQPRSRVEGYRSFDWSPEDGVAFASTTGERARYTIDEDDPKRLRVRYEGRALQEQSARVTPGRVDIRDAESGRFRSRFIWSRGDALNMSFDTGQSRVRVRHGEHGAVRSYVSRPLPDYRGRIAPITWSTERDEQGRLVSVDLGKNGITAHLTYGCSWPSEFDPPAPPDDAGQ